MHDPWLTVIVPAYNCEKSLPACLGSVLGQSMGDLEAVVVDDGSTDGTGLIADGFSRQDGRVRVIHQANLGQSAAKNRALLEARGAYLGFCDADDWLDADMFERLRALADPCGADIACTGFKLVDAAGSTLETRLQPLAGAVLKGEGQTARYRASLYGGLPTDARSDPTPTANWASVFRRDAIERLGVRFAGVSFFEDAVFGIDACRGVGTVVVGEGAPYNYRKGAGPTLTQGYARDKLGRMERSCELLLSRAGEEPGELAEECRLRAHRSVCAAARDLVFQAVGAIAPGPERRREVARVCGSPVFSGVLAAYPHKLLPLWERAVHRSMARRAYGALVALSGVRSLIQRFAG